MVDSRNKLFVGGMKNLKLKAVLKAKSTKCKTKTQNISVKLWYNIMLIIIVVQWFFFLLL